MNELSASPVDGINYNHEDLRDNIWTNPQESPNGVDDDQNGYVDDIHGIDAEAGSGNVLPSVNDYGHLRIHGTMIAGVVGARGDNGVGIAGVAWQVPIMALKVPVRTILAVLTWIIL